MDTNLKVGIRIRPVRLNFKITHEDCFSMLLAMIWANHTLLTYFRAVLIRIPYISGFREHIVTGMFLLILLLSLPYIVKHIQPGLVIGYLLIASVYLVNMLIFPRNQEALDEHFVPFLIESLPMVFVGAAMDLKKHYRMLYIISLIAVIIKFVHLLLEPSYVMYGDMNSSYNLLPHVCLVIAVTLSQRSIPNIAASLVGVVAIFSFGTRGPILCILALVILYMLLYKKIYKHIWFFFSLLVCVLGIIFFYDQIIGIFLDLIRKMGMSTRIFDMLLAGDIMESSGRNVIQARLLEAVSDNWFGYGIAGDRAIVGAYAHNILIELWVSYGVILGTAFFVVPIIGTVILLYKKCRYNNVEDTLILALISSCYVKLFLSGTYLTESLLFLLSGVLVSESRVAKNRGLTIYNQNVVD